MLFPYTLSTTSHLSFSGKFTSSTHPSLPSAATSERNLLRTSLKTFKRLSSTDQTTNLNDLLTATSRYLKYLCSLDAALSGKQLAGEDVDLALIQEVELEWRPTLASTPMPGREPDRVRGRGLDYDFYFVHHTYALIQTLLARQALLGLYAPTTPNSEQRLALIQQATKNIKTAYSIHAFLLAHATFSDEGPPVFSAGAVDISSTMQTALQRLCQAEFNLLSALKDDPYPALLVQSRNENDKEWMIKAPSIPKTRTQVLTRLCIGAAEHCAGASALLKAEKRASREFAAYIDELRRTARARACRFQAIDADARNQTGIGIAWLHAGLAELGVEVDMATNTTTSASGLSRLKSSFQERREDKRIHKGSARWGADAGRAEEVRVLEYLGRKFVKSNDAVHFQKVPEHRGLVGGLPGGMNMPLSAERWVPPVLSEEELVVMRAPPGDDGMELDSSGDEEDKKGVVGAFPGAEEDYKASYY